MSQNLANPLVRPLMHLYPEVAGPISEFFQANKMLATDDASLDQSQLMWADWKGAPQRHFYIKEIAQLRNGSFVIPLKWITVSGVESFDGYAVVHDAIVSAPCPPKRINAYLSNKNKTFRIECERLVRVVAEDLSKNCLDLKAQGYIFLFDGVFIYALV